MQRPPAPIEERKGDGDVCASSLPHLVAYNRHFPLVPVQRQSNELPATVGECRRGPSLRRHKGGRWTVPLTSRHHVLQGGFNVSLPRVQQDCGGYGGHGSAPGGAFSPRVGSPWWSSGGTTQPPVGDRPEERRAPTQRLEGTNPRTGRRYLLTLSATASSS